MATNNDKPFKPYDLIKEYMASLSEHDQQVIKDFHSVKMRVYRKKTLDKANVGRKPLDPEQQKENKKKIRRKYIAKLKQTKIDNGTYRPPGRPKTVKEEKTEEKTEEKVE